MFMATKNIFTIFPQRDGSNSPMESVYRVPSIPRYESRLEPIKSLNLFVVYFIDQFGLNNLMNLYQ